MTPAFLLLIYFLKRVRSHTLEVKMVQPLGTLVFVSNNSIPRYSYPREMQTCKRIPTKMLLVALFIIIQTVNNLNASPSEWQIKLAHPHNGIIFFSYCHCDKLSKTTQIILLQFWRSEIWIQLYWNKVMVWTRLVPLEAPEESPFPCLSSF